MAILLFVLLAYIYAVLSLGSQISLEMQTQQLNQSHRPVLLDLVLSPKDQWLVRGQNSITSNNCGDQHSDCVEHGRPVRLAAVLCQFEVN